MLIGRTNSWGLPTSEGWKKIPLIEGKKAKCGQSTRARMREKGILHPDPVGGIINQWMDVWESWPVLQKPYKILIPSHQCLRIHPWELIGKVLKMSSLSWCSPHQHQAQSTRGVQNIQRTLQVTRGMNVCSTTFQDCVTLSTAPQKPHQLMVLFNTSPQLLIFF